MRTVGVLQVIRQLVERLGARAAREAVLEDEHRMGGRLAQQAVDLLECRQSLNGGWQAMGF
jgi:hypothetical protein